MSEIIQCPTCAKKFRLPDSPPQEFTCTSCGTVMDLSGFAAAAPAPAAAAQTARASGGGRRRRSGAPVSRHERRAAAHTRRRHTRGSGAADAVDDELGHGGRRYQRRSNNNALVIGSVATLAVAAILVFVLMGQGEEPPADEDGTKASKTTAQGPGGAGTPPADGGTPGAAPGASPGSTPGANPGSTPGAAPGSAPGATPDDPNPTPKPKHRTRPRLKNISLKTFDWPEEVDAATRAAAEEHLENMLEVGGRDGRDGEEWFQAQGRKVCGRLISEFPRIIEKHGMDRQGMMRLMVLDRVLSSIDGTLEREWRSRQRITHVTNEKIAMSRLKRWTWWWDSGLWKEAPVEPWDPREDEIDPELEKKKDEEGKGFGKRAGK